MNGARECFRLARLLNDAESVAEPLDGRAGNEDRRLERIDRRTDVIARDSGEQTISREGPFFASVEQQEGTSAICVLAGPGRDAPLAEQRSLLVAGDSKDRHVHTERRRLS